jgi:hypothetical protein
VWRESGIFSQIFGFFFALAAGRNLASVAFKKVPHLVYFIKAFYAVYILMRFTNIILQQVILFFNKNGFIPVNFDVSY